MRYDPNIYKRRSIRLKGYDYSKDGLYFVTICVKNRKCLFGDIKDGEMILNHNGEIVDMVWDELSEHYHNIRLDAFVIMPNHIHGIIEIIQPQNVVGAGFKPAPTGTMGYKPLSEIVRALKTFSARKINEYRNSIGSPLWQRNYYEHVIRNEQSFLEIADYIQNNPLQWMEDELYTL